MAFLMWRPASLRRRPVWVIAANKAVRVQAHNSKDSITPKLGRSIEVGVELCHCPDAAAGAVANAAQRCSDIKGLPCPL